MSWSITIPALFPSRWTTTIVGFTSNISTTKTFDFSGARILFVIRLPLTLFTSLRTSPLPLSIERACFSDSSIELTISLNCGSVKFRPFWSNFRRSSCTSICLSLDHEFAHPRLHGLGFLSQSSIKLFDSFVCQLTCFTKTKPFIRNICLGFDIFIQGRLYFVITIWPSFFGQREINILQI